MVKSERNKLMKRKMKIVCMHKKQERSFVPNRTQQYNKTAMNPYNLMFK